MVYHERVGGTSAQQYGNRAGTGVLDTAEDGAVRDYIVGLILSQHHLNVGHVRDLTRAKFGKRLKVVRNGEEKTHDLPNFRTFARFIKNWKDENELLHLKITNPDAAKNKHMMAFGRADADVERLNQLWEIDASPVDVLLLDGRYNLYALIDVWSRRVKIHISKTATTEASLQLVRKGILDWGVPETIKTDNGSDFKSHRFVNALASLEIDQDICTPFSPEQKPHVERVIGTLQRDLMPMLPGFIGHNVSDRKLIEARKTFAQRLGTDDAKAFAVQMTQEEMQRFVDQWADDRYANKTHSSIGVSPFAKAASWNKPIRKIENERALDILLAPLSAGSSTRRITKQGIRINGYTYAASGMEIYLGKEVFIRCDPDDMGTIHCFQPESKEYLFSAQNPELCGKDRKQVAMAVKKAQKAFMKEHTAEARRQMNSIKGEDLALMMLQQDKNDHSNVASFPQRSETYLPAALDEASKVDAKDEIKSHPDDEIAKRQRLIAQEMSLNTLAPTTAKTDHDIWWDRAQALMFKCQNNIEISGQDQAWLEFVQKQPWFIARRDLMAMRREDIPQ